jgi:hypothetical protein
MSEPAAASTGLAGLIASVESAGVPVSQVQAKVVGLVGQRPEVAVVAAFAGGLMAAMIVRRLGR